MGKKIMGKKKAQATPTDQIPVAELLEIVSRYAERFSWCSEAEDVLSLTLGLQVVGRSGHCGCADCRRERGEPPGRFTLANGQPEFVTREQLELALKILRIKYNWQAGAKLIAYTLTRKYKLDLTYRKFLVTGSMTIPENELEQNGWRGDVSRAPNYMRAPFASEIQAEQVAA